MRNKIYKYGPENIENHKGSLVKYQPVYEASVVETLRRWGEKIKAAELTTGKRKMCKNIGYFGIVNFEQDGTKKVSVGRNKILAT